MQALINYEKITDEQLSALNKEETIIFLPISLLEAHGPHLPLGTDFLMASHLSSSLAERLVEMKFMETAVLLPAVPLGAGGIIRQGTLNHGMALVEQVIIEFGEHLAEYGFKKGIIVSGHAGEKHLKAMSEASEVLKAVDLFNFLPLTSILFSKKGMEAMKGALKERYKRNPKAALPQYDGHAGRWETSLALTFFPELVHEKYKELPPSESAEANGYRGEPAMANQQFGLQLKEFLLEMSLKIIKDYF